MKILVLASASVLAFAAPAFAQSQVIDVTQIPTTSSNISAIDQVGNSNKAKVNQADMENRSVIVTNGDDNRAYVNMGIDSGSNNISAISQGEEGASNKNLADVWINGKDNFSVVTQDGAGENNAKITLVGNNGVNYAYQTGYKNKATIDTTPASSNATSAVLQYGDNNTTTVALGGTDNYSAVVQYGNGNTGTVTSTGTNGQSAVIQLTDSNVATVSQYGANDWSVVQQDGGNGNVATIMQSGANAASYASSFGTGNTVTVNQY